MRGRGGAGGIAACLLGLGLTVLQAAPAAAYDLTDADGLTALQYAARTDYGVEIAELLLSKRADVNARGNSGRTPFDHATELGLQRMPPPPDPPR